MICKILRTKEDTNILLNMKEVIRNRIKREDFGKTKHFRIVRQT